MIHAQNMAHVPLLTTQAVTNGATASGTVAWGAFDYATIVVALSSEKNTDAVGPEIVIQHCDTSDGTFTTLSSVSHATAAANYLLAAKNLVFHVDLKTRAKYGKILVSPGTETNDNVTVAAIALLSRAEQTPSSTSGMVLTKAGSASTQDACTIV